MYKLQRTVLLVDDAKEDRILIRRALRQDPTVDYRVLEAENGAQALSCLRQQQPDCLLLDYQLPDTDGLTLLKTVVDQAAPHIYPVVMLTHTYRTTLVVETMQRGAHDFLPKSNLSAEHLQQAINNATEKVALLRQLEEQRAWFRLTLASINDGVITTNTEGVVTFMNPVAEALTHCTAAEAQGRPLAKIFCVSDETTRQPVIDPVTHVLRTHQSISQTNQTLLAGQSGSELPIDYNAALIQDQLGAAIGVVITFRDVSARKAAEVALRMSEEFNRTVLESSPDCVKVLDAEGRLLMMNQPGLALMEIDDFRPFAGQPWTQLWPAACTPKIHEALATAQRGELARFQDFCPTAKGTPKWWDVIVAPVRNAAGEFPRFVAVSRDITESKRAEEVLHERTALLHGLIESMPTPIWAKDRAGRTTLGNQATFDLIAGGEPAQVLGRTALEMFPASEQARQVMESDQRVMRTGITEVSEHPFRTLDHQRFFQTIKAPLRNLAGEVVGLVGVSVDMTERKQAEFNQQFLLDLDAQTHLQDDAAAILTLTAERVGQYLGVAHCAFNEVDPAADQCVFLTHWRRRSALPDLTGPHALSSMVGADIVHALTQGQNVIVPDMARDPRTLPLVDHYRASHMQSMVCVPFQSKGQRLATLTVAEERLLAWRADEIALLENVLARIWPLMVKARAEAALRRQEEMLRQITDNVPALIGYLDTDEQYRIVNAAFETWFQRPRQQIIGRTARQLLGAAAYAKFTPYRQQALAGTTVTYEDRLTYPDGVNRAIWARYHPDIAADGRVLGFYLFVMDISERKQAEDDARFLADVVEMIRLTDNVDALMGAVTQSVGNYLQVGRCRFIEVDRANDRAIIHRDYCRDVPSVAGAFRLSNYQPSTWGEMAAGHTLVNHDAQHDVRTAALYDRVYAPTKERAYIGVPLMRNGEWQGVFSVTTPDARQWQPREIQLLETIAERTWLAVEKLRLDAALRASEEQLRQITDNLPGLISVVNAQEEYEFVNRNYQRWLGLEPTQMRGRKIALALPDQRAYQMLQPHLRRALAGETVTFENQLRTTQGNALDVMVTHVPRRDAAGQVTGCYILAMDLTERKRLEEALRASEARLNAILYNIPASVYMLTTDHRYLLVNRVYEQENNITNAAIHGQSVYDRWPAAVAARLVATERQVLATKAPITVEEAVLRDGETRYYVTVKAPLLDMAGEPSSIIGISFDITARKQAEAALAAREAFLRSITDAVPNLIGYIDQHRRYRFVNATYAQWFARPREAIEGSKMQDLLGEHLNTWRKHWQRALAGETVHFEETFTYPDGVTRTVMGTYIPDRNAAGEVLGFYVYINDITARKLAEARVRESEARMKLAANVGGFGFHDFNIAADDLYWSDELYALHHLPPGTKITLAHIDQLIHPDDLKRMQITMQAALDPQGTGEFEQEFRIILPDTKETRWLYNKSQTYFEGKGKRRKAIRNTGIVADITERKEAEKALRESEARQASILETMAEGVMTIDCAGHFFSANAAAERILGIPRSELIGQSINTPPYGRFDLDGTPWGERPLLAEIAAAGKRVFHHDYVIERRDGACVVVARNITALRTTDETLLGFVATLSDITEQKRAETALRDSEARFRAVANLVPDLLWSNDPVGVTDWYNQRWLEYTGQTLENATADGWLAAVHPEERAHAFHSFQQAFAQGEPLRQEQRIGSATGEYRWFLVQASPLKDAAGKTLRWFGAATDIHEQRTAREMLEQRVQERTHELKVLSISRQQLLERVLTAQEDERRRIAHELHDTLGQFLSALNLRLSLLQQSIQPQEGPVSPVVEELGQLWQLVNEIDGELRRLTMELRPPILDDLGLDAAIRRYVEAWSRMTAIPVDVYINGLAGARLAPTVELPIYRIVQEALTNVLKHAHATAVSVILERRPKELQLIIEDNGIGFDPSVVGGQTEGRSTLGLLGMKERAALVGGQVELESTAGAGTTIYVHIPFMP